MNIKELTQKIREMQKQPNSIHKFINKTYGNPLNEAKLENVEHMVVETEEGNEIQENIKDEMK